MVTNNKNLISFIIPVYNSEEYLSHCIDSILNQKIDNIEIILIDDGSTDTSGTICDQYSKKYQNIRTIHQKNAGVANARNTGIKAASGKYLQFVDNDDWINKGELAKLMDIIHIADVDIIIHKYLIIGERISTGNSVIKAEKINGKGTREILLYLRTSRVNITAPWEYTVKRSVIFNRINFNPDQNGVDDSVFTPLVFCNALSFYFNNNFFYSWRIRLNSQGNTHNDRELIIKMISTIETLTDYLSKTRETYKQEYLLYRIYKNIYSLLGPYFKYSQDDRAIVEKWYYKNIDLIQKSASMSGRFHRAFLFIFGNLYGTMISYRLALLKSLAYSIIYDKRRSKRSE